MYIEEEKSIYEIGDLLGVSGTAIQYHLKLMGIDRRLPSEYTSGARNPMYGKTHTPEAREKIRAANARQFAAPGAREHHAELTAQQIAGGKTGKSHNGLESRLAALMAQADIRYEWGFRLGRFVFDFRIPARNLLVECDGTFWHADPRFYPNRESLTAIQRRNTENDQRKDRAASEAGYAVIRLWEHDIWNDPDGVISRLKAS